MNELNVHFFVSSVLKCFCGKTTGSEISLDTFCICKANESGVE